MPCSYHGSGTAVLTQQYLFTSQSTYYYRLECLLCRTAAVSRLRSIRSAVDICDMPDRAEVSGRLVETMTGSEFPAAFWSATLVRACRVADQLRLKRIVDLDLLSSLNCTCLKMKRWKSSNFTLIINVDRSSNFSFMSIRAMCSVQQPCEPVSFNDFDTENFGLCRGEDSDPLGRQ